MRPQKTDLLVTKIKTRPYKIISPIFWILSISAKSRKIYWSWQIVSFWGYSLTLFSVGVSKFYSHFFFGHHVDVYDFLCFSSPGKGSRSLRNSCRQRGRWRAHEQVHWTRCTLNNLVILDQIDFSSSLCENPWIKFGEKFSLISNSERVVILRLGVSTCRTFCGHFYS